MIELKHIEFAYESGSELLRDINMQVNDGEYIAIVGENGSGKSTLVKLLLGLLEPSKGELKNTFSKITPSADEIADRVKSANLDGVDVACWGVDKGYISALKSRGLYVAVWSRCMFMICVTVL